MFTHRPLPPLCKSDRDNTRSMQGPLNVLQCSFRVYASLWEVLTGFTTANDVCCKLSQRSFAGEMIRGVGDVEGMEDVGVEDVECVDGMEDVEDVESVEGMEGVGCMEGVEGMEDVESVEGL